jgi:hypothetical protein
MGHGRAEPAGVPPAEGLWLLLAGRGRAGQLSMTAEMPVVGDLIIPWSVRPGHCFRMVYSCQLQADHCPQRVEWKGVWRDPKGKSHYVETCGEHAPKASQAFSGYVEQLQDRNSLLPPKGQRSIECPAPRR